MNLLETAMMMVIKRDPYWKFPPLHLKKVYKLFSSNHLGGHTYLSPLQQQNSIYLYLPSSPNIIVIHPPSLFSTSCVQPSLSVSSFTFVLLFNKSRSCNKSLSSQASSYLYSYCRKVEVGVEVVFLTHISDVSHVSFPAFPLPSSPSACWWQLIIVSFSKAETKRNTK